jgi:hypothetical protein
LKVGKMSIKSANLTAQSRLSGLSLCTVDRNLSQLLDIIFDPICI